MTETDALMIALGLGVATLVIASSSGESGETPQSGSGHVPSFAQAAQAYGLKEGLPAIDKPSKTAKPAPTQYVFNFTPPASDLKTPSKKEVKATPPSTVSHSTTSKEAVPVPTKEKIQSMEARAKKELKEGQRMYFPETSTLYERRGDRVYGYSVLPESIHPITTIIAQPTKKETNQSISEIWHNILYIGGEI